MYNISVTKLTDLDLLHRANKTTSGATSSTMTLRNAYAKRHSVIRTQLFHIQFDGIPLFVASQLVRHHAGADWWQQSKRVDAHPLSRDFVKEVAAVADILDSASGDAYNLRTRIDMVLEKIGDWPYSFDRMQPVKLMGVLNAEAIINISHARLCCRASNETREVWQKVVDAIREADPDLAFHCVPKCTALGYCPEGYNRRGHDTIRKESSDYRYEISQHLKAY